MQTSDPGSLRVGHNLTAHDFLITPRDLADHVESSFLVDVVGCCEERLSTGANSGSRSVSQHPWGRVCPTPVAVGRAVAALLSTSELQDAHIVSHSVNRVRELGPALVGEPLSATASVRYRSRRAGAIVVTLDVSVRRPAGATRLNFELAVELESIEIDDAA